MELRRRMADLALASVATAATSVNNQSVVLVSVLSIERTRVDLQHQD